MPNGDPGDSTVVNSRHLHKTQVDHNFTLLHCNSWDRSAKLCKTIGKELAFPKNQEDNDKFYKAAGNYGSFQVGIQKDNELGWVDEQGQGLTFENWEANYPQKKSPPGKEIAAIGGKGKWTNQYLNTKLNALCV